MQTLTKTDDRPALELINCEPVSQADRNHIIFVFAVIAVVLLCAACWLYLAYTTFVAGAFSMLTFLGAVALILICVWISTAGTEDLIFEDDAPAETEAS